MRPRAAPAAAAAAARPLRAAAGGACGHGASRTARRGAAPARALALLLLACACTRLAHAQTLYSCTATGCSTTTTYSGGGQMCATYLPLAMTCSGTPTWYDPVGKKFMYWSTGNFMQISTACTSQPTTCTPSNFGCTYHAYGGNTDGSVNLNQRSWILVSPNGFMEVNPTFTCRQA